VPRARLLTALLAPVLLVATGSPGLAAAPTDSAAIRREASDALRRGDRKAALEAARRAIAADATDVEAHVLYQESARGELAPAILISEYRGRLAREPGDASTFLLSRLVPVAEAEKLLRDSISKDPRAYWGQVGLSSVMARIGRGSEAEAAALAALALRPQDAAAASRAGAQCAEAHRFEPAEACFRTAVERAPGDAGARLGLAHALLRLGKLDDAAGIIASLSGERSPDRRALLLAASLAMEKGDLAGAEKSLVQVVGGDPKDMDALLHLVRVRLRKAKAASEKSGKPLEPKNLGIEIADLQRVLVALPERADAYYALGNAYEVVGKFEEALGAYREVARIDTLDPDVFTSIGAVLLAREQIEDAIRELRKATDRNKKDAEALFHLGRAHTMQGKAKEAADFYQQALKIEPGSARAWNALGHSQDSLGKPGDGGKSYAKAVELAPEVGRFQRDHGETLFAGRKYDAALAALEKAVSLDEKDATAWSALGRTRMALRKYPESAEAYEKMAALAAENADVHLLLGALYHEFLKDYEKALAHYQKYLALGGEPDDVDAWVIECQDEIAKKKD